MKRFTCSLIILLALVGCSRKGPTPTSPPSPSPTESQPALPATNPTPPGSPVPRITLVPSATRIQPAQEQVIWEGTAVPTGTATLQPSPTSSPTPTPRIINAGPTATPRPSLTATVPESPLPESPLPTPSVTGTSAAASSDATEVPDTATPDTTTPSPTSAEGSAAATATLTVSPSATATATATATSAPSGEAWSFRNVFTHYDEDFQEFYIWGEVVNNTGRDQRITSLTPVVYDADGAPIMSEEDVLGLWNYEELLKLVSIAPEKSLAFSFLVFLSDETPFPQDFEVLVEAEATEPARQDLVIIGDEYDSSRWPDYLDVFVSYENPGPDLNAHVAVVVTVYDEDEQVIGVGWTYETTALFLEAGTHDFEVEVEMWEIVNHLGVEIYSYKVQVFGD